ncbi:MAG: hypothetical protein B6244_03475 [Candidatus Cloacimonetes bacterium 4572_55]|nr:MAG: hypothetical protein B6244_03475 [Candidatus Cloacimonetes bacterium 4572_55]
MQPTPTKKLILLDIFIDNLTMDEAIQKIEEICNGDRLHQISFVNAACFNISFKDAEYRDILIRSDYLFGDGSGVRYGAKMTGQRIKDNVNGTDMYPRLCRRAAEKGWRIFYLGASEDSNERIVRDSLRRYPKLQVSGRQNGYFSLDQTHEVIERIKASNCDILLVAFGAPRQEKWIDQHKDTLKNSVKAIIGVGGLFDYVNRDAEKSAGIPRAPIWIRKIGFEWVYRLIQEPKRMWKRYVLGNPLYLWRVFLWSIRNRDKIRQVK